jgi:hypothetical protein
MLNVFQASIRHLLHIITGPQVERSAICPPWCSDPLSHPDLQKMSLNQLADLPFDAARICAQPNHSSKSCD